MKNTFKAMLAVAALGIASTVSAISIPSTGTVKISNTPYDGGQNPGLQGGEYKAEIAGFDAFYTFCVERDSTINTGQSYSYSLSMVKDEDGGPLTKGTAYLYKKFVQGTLYPRLEDGDTGLHDMYAGQLQAAIWYLGGQVGAGFKYIAGNPFLAMVASEFGGAEFDAASADMGVRVMNLFDANGNQIQDVIVYVPDSGMTLALLGLGVSAIALVRRRYNS